MKKVTVAVIGSYNKKGFLSQSKKLGIEVIHHDGTSPRKKEFTSIVKRADSVVVISKACGHTAMDFVKEVCKETNTPISFSRVSGVSGVLREAIELAS